MEGFKKRLKCLEDEMMIQRSLIRTILSTAVEPEALDKDTVLLLRNSIFFEFSQVQAVVLCWAVSRKDLDMIRDIISDNLFQVTEKHTSYMNRAISAKSGYIFCKILMKNEKIRQAFADKNWLQRAYSCHKQIVASYSGYRSRHQDTTDFMCYMVRYAHRYNWSLKFYDNEFIRIVIQYHNSSILKEITRLPPECREDDSIFKQAVKVLADLFTSYKKMFCLEQRLFLESCADALFEAAKSPNVDLNYMYSISHPLHSLTIAVWSNNPKYVKRILHHPKFILSDYDVHRALSYRKAVYTNPDPIELEILRLCVGHSVRGLATYKITSSWRWTPQNWPYFPRAKQRVYREFLCCVKYLLGTTRLIKDLHEMIMTRFMPVSVEK